MLVLEGRDRVGGKILTFSDVPGLPEAGGQSIGSGYGRLIDAANRSGVVLEDVLPRQLKHPDIALVLDGAPVPKAAWPQSPRNPFPPPLRETMPWMYTPVAMAKANPLQAIEDWIKPENARFDVSMYEFLKAQGASDAMIDLAYDTNVSYGTSAHDVSALMMEFVEGFIRAQRGLKPAIYKARGGNQRIPEGMARRLKGGVHLKQVVTGIRADDGGVEVRTADGKRYQAKAVICALPFSTLRHVRFDPLLAGAQQRAVATLPHQMITQVALRSKRPFWEQDGLPPTMWTDSQIGRVFGIYGGSDRRRGLEPAGDGLWVQVGLARPARPGSGGPLRGRGDGTHPPGREGRAERRCIPLVDARPVQRRGLGLLRTGNGHAVHAGDVPAARPRAFLRRADRGERARHGRCDGIRRAGCDRGGNAARLRRQPALDIGDQDVVPCAPRGATPALSSSISTLSR